jgi:hypothetical protein
MPHAVPGVESEGGPRSNALFPWGQSQRAGTIRNFARYWRRMNGTGIPAVHPKRHPAHCSRAAFDFKSDRNCQGKITVRAAKPR